MAAVTVGGAAGDRASAVNCWQTGGTDDEPDRPALLAALDEGEDEQAQTDGGQAGASQVEAGGVGGFGLGQRPDGTGEGGYPDGDVDEEDQSPRQLGDVEGDEHAAQQRPEDGGQADDSAEYPEDLAP